MAVARRPTIYHMHQYDLNILNRMCSHTSTGYQREGLIQRFPFLLALSNRVAVRVESRGSFSVVSEPSLHAARKRNKGNARPWSGFEEP
jgi:hypothetical protein